MVRDANARKRCDAVQRIPGQFSSKPYFALWQVVAFTLARIPHWMALLRAKTAPHASRTMKPLTSRSLVMSTNDVLEARLDMLSLAIECVDASLSAAQAREVASAFSDRLSLLLTTANLHLPQFRSNLVCHTFYRKRAT